MSRTIHQALIGATITAVSLEPSGSYIELALRDQPPVRLDAVGDCCSQTWIESLDAPAALLGTVQEIDDIDMPDLGNIAGARHDDVDQVKYYGLKIVTNKGVCVIDYRNDSNGYYGGELVVHE